MLTNARLIAYRPLGAPTGRGEPTFGANIVAAVMPACQVAEPTRRRVDTPDSDHVEADMLVTVPRATFAYAGHLPKTGDRLTVQPDGALSERQTADVVSAKDADGRVVVLACKERVDERRGVC